jgi:hypothetical protein
MNSKIIYTLLNLLAFVKLILISTDGSYFVVERTRFVS